MADKRQQIEEAATAAISKGGLSSISFRTLADEVGVKSSSVHYHFATKADLAEAVIRTYTEDFSGVLGQIVRDEKTLRGRIERMLTAFEALADKGSFCLCGAIAADASDLDDATRGALRTFFKVTEAWLTAVIDEGRSELSTELASADLAKVLLASLEGACLIDRAVGGAEHLVAVRGLVDSISRSS